MRFKYISATLLCIFSGFLSSGYAQTFSFMSDGRPDIPATIIDAKAAASAIDSLNVGLGGKVNVRVTIDESGNVSSAETVAGPGAICRAVTRSDVAAAREAATAAALTVKFSPAKINEQPTASTGWLYFELVNRADSKESVYAAKNSDQKRFTVKGDANYTADYKGPVNTSGTGGGQGSKITTAPIPEPSGTPPSGVLPGGVLNGKAIELPKPPYPPAAKAVRASGAVSIQVLIDENGEVFTASAVSGHPLLRSASTLAACGAKFQPTKLEGNPVKVSGIITYNFVSP